MQISSTVDVYVGLVNITSQEPLPVCISMSRSKERQDGDVDPPTTSPRGVSYKERYMHAATADTIQSPVGCQFSVDAVISKSLTRVQSTTGHIQ